MTIDKLFDILDDWRKLPSYQLERRADIFFAYHLREIFAKIKNVEIDLIIPEFPVRIGEIPGNDKSNNKSFKIDYLAIAKQKVYLIELKTDLRSRREEQDQYLFDSARLKTKNLISGLLKIYNATKQKRKYSRLLDKFETIGWIKRAEETIENLAPDIKPEIFYIQPLSKNETESITFDNIISALSDSNDPITKRFIISLEKWKSDTNKK